MSYARDATMLASVYGRTPYAATVALKGGIDEVLGSAARIEITCPLGTRLAGSPQGRGGDDEAEVSVRRFPLGVPRPVAAHRFSGRVALARWLTPTGSRVYDPACAEIATPVLAEVEGGRIVGLAGEPGAVAGIRRHYARVAERFGIDPDVVHSWHAGIHPGCAYRGDAGTDPDRWSNTVFTHPRFLHFHTCGGYAPGEICWMVLDPTVTVDGVALWDGGGLRPEAFAPTRTALAAWPVLAALFRGTAGPVGLPGSG